MQSVKKLFMKHNYRVKYMCSTSTVYSVNEILHSSVINKRKIQYCTVHKYVSGKEGSEYFLRHLSSLGMTSSWRPQKLKFDIFGELCFNGKLSHFNGKFFDQKRRKTLFSYQFSFLIRLVFYRYIEPICSATKYFLSKSTACNPQKGIKNFSSPNRPSLPAIEQLSIYLVIIILIHNFREHMYPAQSAP